jgi:nucleoside-diphosphate-sugar epimerase
VKEHGVSLPSLIITGASGFVGRHLLDGLKNEYRIFALARRSQHDCGAPVHPNIAWMQVDIGDRETLTRTFREIATAGGASRLIHLAAYYDFTGEGHPEYERTNVTGTRNILDAVSGLGLERIYFASSVAACPFPKPGDAITERTPPDGDHVYAYSKRRGEEMMREFSKVVPTCTVRFGAIYSDWCEYVPLYYFLEQWLGRSWRSRILAGRGESAIPYIHIREIETFFRMVMAVDNTLERHEVFIASTDEPVSHREIFEQIRLSFSGEAETPILLPRPIAYAGLHMLNGFGIIIGRQPFERPWMIKYVDRKLHVNATHTTSRLGWRRNPRLRLMRRIPFLIERFKNEPIQWHSRNAAILRRTHDRPDLRILTTLRECEPDIVLSVIRDVRAPSRRSTFATFSRLDDSELSWNVRLILKLLGTSIQTSNRLLILDYFELSAGSRFQAGLTGHELSTFLHLIGERTLQVLLSREELSGMKQALTDRITLPIEIGKDEIEEQYSRFQRGEAALPTASGFNARQQLEDTIWSCLVNRQ